MRVGSLLICALVVAAPVFAWPLGDTLTVIQRPILGVPTILAAGETLEVECEAPPSTGKWSVSLFRKPLAFELDVTGATYDADADLWRLRAAVPFDQPEELYDLVVTGTGVDPDTARHAVKVLDEYPDEWVFAQVTDTHLPGHTFSPGRGWDTDSTEERDFREVIDDLNLIAPEFLLLTGDLINEGELEDHQEYRVYSRAKRLLQELDMPVFLVAGNHDIGGWVDTPPPAGTARRDWWRFFGWKRLGDPDADVRTQDYFFDFGGVRFIGLEAYDNYDHYQTNIYGNESFRRQQLEFLRAAVDGAAEDVEKVLFCHMDFSRQLTNVGAWDLDLMLYGHIHRDDGSVNDPIPVLATESCCDGNRAYRIVKVKSGVVKPRETLHAGPDGRKVTVVFDRPNDGTAVDNGAKLSSGQDQPLDEAEIRFVVAKEGAPYGASGGVVDRVFDADTALVVVVRAPVEPHSTVRVALTAGHAAPSPPPPPPPTSIVYLGNAPNPFNGVTDVRFEIPREGRVEVRLYDIKGRYLFPIARGLFPEGESSVPWDGTAPSGVRVPAGVYFVKVLFEDSSRTGRIVFLR